MDRCLLSTGRDDWRTPPEVLALVQKVMGGIDLDPCANSIVKIANHNWYGGESTCGLSNPWFGRVYVNPPYSNLKAWAQKCAIEGSRGREIILLCAARTDTKAFHEYIAKANACCLWKGRLTFVGAPNPAPFPSLFAYWGPNTTLFRQVFRDHGKVI